MGADSTAPPSAANFNCANLTETYIVEGFAAGAWTTFASGTATGILVNPNTARAECAVAYHTTMTAAQLAPYTSVRVAAFARATNGTTTVYTPVTDVLQEF
jgi:hypothetical protein